MAKGTKDINEVFDFTTSAYLAGAKALVVMGESRDMVGDANTPTDDITVKGVKEQIKFVKRGDNNNLPAEMMDKILAKVTQTLPMVYLLY
jgi:hypothetical protein